MVKHSLSNMSALSRSLSQSKKAKKVVNSCYRERGSVEKFEKVKGKGVEARV